MTGNNSNKQSVINSPLETELRILLLLSQATVWPLSLEVITDIDFMAVYGKEFGLSSFDLHGENKYKFGQLAAKRALAEEAIKRLVRLGLIEACLQDGYKYMITQEGTEIIEKMNDGFSEDYRKTVLTIFKKYDLSNSKTIENALKTARNRGRE